MLCSWAIFFWKSVPFKAGRRPTEGRTTPACVAGNSDLLAKGQNEKNKVRRAQQGRKMATVTNWPYCVINLVCSRSIPPQLVMNSQRPV